MIFPRFCIFCRTYPHRRRTSEELSTSTSDVKTGTFVPDNVVPGTGGWLCEGCLKKIEFIAAAKKIPMPQGLDGFIGVGYYHDPVLRKVIHELKYHGATSLLPAVEHILRRYTDTRAQPWPWAGETSLAIQPVVGVPKRVRARGFDQAELLANAVRTAWVPWAEPAALLKRRKKSVSRQADLDVGPLRAANVAGSFELSSNSLPLRTASVILTDDVVTSGSTMAEAARVLRLAGVERIYGIALAVGT